MARERSTPDPRIPGLASVADSELDEMHISDWRRIYPKARRSINFPRAENSANGNTTQLLAASHYVQDSRGRSQGVLTWIRDRNRLGWPPAIALTDGRNTERENGSNGADHDRVEDDGSFMGLPLLVIRNAVRMSYVRGQ